MKKIFAMIALFAVALLPMNSTFAAPGDPLVKGGECTTGAESGGYPTFQDFTATSPAISGVVLYTYGMGGSLTQVQLLDGANEVFHWDLIASQIGVSTITLDAGPSLFIPLTPQKQYRISTKYSGEYLWLTCDHDYTAGSSGGYLGRDYRFETFLLTSPI